MTSEKYSCGSATDRFITFPHLIAGFGGRFDGKRQNHGVWKSCSESDGVHYDQSRASLPVLIVNNILEQPGNTGRTKSRFPRNYGKTNSKSMNL